MPVSLLRPRSLVARWMIVTAGCGLLLAGISHCGGEKQKDTHSEPPPIAADVPADWTGTEDWAGSPWTLEDE